MYGKIFDSIYDGTLRANWKALITFQQLIILSDSDGVIDMTPHAIHGRTGIPLDIIEEGLKHLAEPDPYSRSSTEQGRRIILVDPSRPWGWRLVNHAYYRDLLNRADKREKDRVRIAEKRAKESKTSQDVAVCRNESRDVANVAHTNTNTDANADTDTGNNYPGLAQEIFSLIQKLNPKHKQPNFTNWANDIRLMVERDGRTLDEIKSLFEWANDHHFWKSNILSPAKLRKQWDTLIIQRKTGGQHAARPRADNSAPGRVRAANNINR